MRSKLAIVSFIFGILSLFLLSPFIFPNSVNITGILSWILFNPLYPLLGLILGIISIYSIKKEKLGGIWFAIFGIIFSLIGIIAMVWFALAFAAFMRSWF